MTAREEARAAFLAQTGWQDAAQHPLAGDASLRRYIRLNHPKFGPAMLMDAPPETGEDCRPFVAVNHWLKDQGFSAPELLGFDLAQGFVLLEDLGDDLFAPLMAAGSAEDERMLYEAAIDLLADLHSIEAPASLPVAGADDWPLAPYNEAKLLEEAALLPDWFWQLHHGAPMTGAAREEFNALWRGVLPAAIAAKPVFVHRDYHAENLIWLPRRTGHARVGLLDHQDALAGHPAYDLISLIEDARRVVAPELAEHLTQRYCARRKALDATFDEAPFRLAMAILAAQRNTKIVGIFARLSLRDGKPKYLDLIPHVFSMLARDLDHPDLGALKAWADAHFPPAIRAAP